MKCVVSAVAALALKMALGETPQTTLTDVQLKVQAAIEKADFGCHTESVLNLMEALTGRRPTTGKASSKFPICSLVTIPSNVAGKEPLIAIVLGISGSTVYAWGIQFTGNPGSEGYLSVSAKSEMVKGDIAKEYLKTFEANANDELFVPWIVESLGSNYLRQVMQAIK